MHAMNENRVKIKALCEAAGSYTVAAKLIADEMQRSLSVDAIKSWTCNPNSSRARRCPDWAITALEKKLQKKGIVILADGYIHSTATPLECAVSKVAVEQAAA
jgi:hypothetical protein